MARLVPQEAIDMIAQFEGCRLEAYQDVVGVWTIGYGDTGPSVYRGVTITQEEADRRLQERVTNEFGAGVERAVGDAPMTDNQYGAMVSLAYNIGLGAFRRSSVLRFHRIGDYASAARSFGKWNMASGRVFAGLVRRRKAEAELYNTPDGS